MNRFRPLSSMAATLLVALSAHAQSARDAEHALRDRLLHHEVYLRDFSADPVDRWQWEGTALQPEEPFLHEFASVTITSFKLHGSRLSLAGTRAAMAIGRGAPHPAAPVPDRIKIEVDLHGADLATALPALPEQMFFATPEEAKATLARAPEPTGNLCTDPETGQRMKIVAPRLVRQVDPDFSEEARRVKFSGNVGVRFRIETDGSVHNLWAVSPQPFGLSLAAARAVSQYKFEPARCGETPVAKTLFVEVNFQIF